MQIPNICRTAWQPAVLCSLPGLLLLKNNQTLWYPCPIKPAFMGKKIMYSSNILLAFQVEQSKNNSSYRKVDGLWVYAVQDRAQSTDPDPRNTGQSVLCSGITRRRFLSPRCGLKCHCSHISAVCKHKDSTVSYEMLAFSQPAISFLHSLSLKLWVAPGRSVLLFLSGTVNDPI